MNNNLKYKSIKLAFSYFLFTSFLSGNISFAQLVIGDQAPNLVLSSTNNSIQSFAFPNQNKMYLLFFWSTSVSKSKENIYKYKRLFTKYSDIGFKNSDGFDVISVALQSDKVAWENALKEYDLSTLNNCIAQKGYSDFFVKSYKLTETTSSFLIDELGKIVAINPPLNTIIDYLDNKRNSLLNADVQSKLSGKVIVKNVPLINEKIFLLSDKKDTLQIATLDEKGAFLFKNINASIPYYFGLNKSTKINVDNLNLVFLTSENGEIVSNFKNTNNGFEYNLLEAEIPYLKPLLDNEPSIKKDSGALKQLYVCDIVFETKVTVLPKESLLKLNAVITKLKANPKTKLEIISHTDSNGDAIENATLSSNQSNSIVDYIVSRGISKARLKSIGKGESEILNKCHDDIPCSEQEHRVNRRTEFKFYPIP
jgi:outer membrane protein OmpA-like peptidoglycan-associated protein